LAERAGGVDRQQGRAATARTCSDTDVFRETTPALAAPRSFMLARSASSDVKMALTPQVDYSEGPPRV
jgi:hypothetical protein